MEVRPLNWGKLADVAISGAGKPLVVCLDRVTDPHNVGAVLRSAEVFGARAVVAPRHHSAPETGALAKTASGALERQPYLRVTNLADAMGELREMGYVLIGLDGDGTVELADALAQAGSRGEHLGTLTHVRVPDASDHVAQGIVDHHVCRSPYQLDLTRPGICPAAPRSRSEIRLIFSLR